MNRNYNARIYSSSLFHSGRKGQKWGIRNGPPYPIDAQKTVFISGSSKTQEADSVYYRKTLPKPIMDKIDEYIKNGYKILVGDAPGIDRQVQDYLNKKKYEKVEVYGPGKKVRYVANTSWGVKAIDAPEYDEGSKEWLAEKDIAMTNAANEGLAIVLDEGAKATRKNVERLQSQGKGVSVYSLNKDKRQDDWIDPDILRHSGVKGQKHGVRQYQNKDGSLTPLGRIHYGVGKIRERRAEKKKDNFNYKKASDEDLRKKNDRLRMEKDYLETRKRIKELDSDSVDRGKAILGKILGKSVENIGGQLATYAMGTGINKAFGKDIVNPKKGQKKD